MVPPLDLDGDEASHHYLLVPSHIATAALLTNERSRHRPHLFLLRFLYTPQYNNYAIPSPSILDRSPTRYPPSSCQVEHTPHRSVITTHLLLFSTRPTRQPQHTSNHRTKHTRLAAVLNKIDKSSSPFLLFCSITRQQNTSIFSSRTSTHAIAAMLNKISNLHCHSCCFCSTFGNFLSSFPKPTQIPIIDKP